MYTLSCSLSLLLSLSLSLALALSLSLSLSLSSLPSPHSHILCVYFAAPLPHLPSPRSRRLVNTHTLLAQRIDHEENLISIRMTRAFNVIVSFSVLLGGE